MLLSKLGSSRPSRNKSWGEMWVGGGTRGRKERRVGTKEGELKSGHPASVLVVDGADYAQCQFFSL